jgi:hypothetical protein
MPWRYVRFAKVKSVPVDKTQRPDRANHIKKETTFVQVCVPSDEQTDGRVQD